MEEEQDHDGAGDAAQAFEALRAEVAALRQAVEAAAERHAPDYSPDLGRITQAVNGVIDGLEAIEAHPAVRMTPDQFGDPHWPRADERGGAEIRPRPAGRRAGAPPARRHDRDVAGEAGAAALVDRDSHCRFCFYAVGIAGFVERAAFRAE